MARRSDELIDKLTELVDTGKVYFQPPASIKLEYPCFVFHRTDAYQSYANDSNYVFMPSYRVTYINRSEPDPEMIKKVKDAFRYCRYTGHGIIDNLHHDYFTIYY